MIEIEIDGKKLKTEPGKMIIQVADEAGIYIPRFCYHKKLTIAANCRMCLIEVEKSRKPLPACAVPVADGMKVYTQSGEARRSQKAVMEFLLINHPLDCPICDQGGECELQDLALGFGRDVSRFNEGKRSVKDEDLGPLIATDMTRCIHCTRCVRFMREVAGLEELGALDRGEAMRIGTEVLALRELDQQDLASTEEITQGLQHVMQSEVSGNIIDLCPVGALTSKPFRFRARPWELTQKSSIAPHDCLGSRIFVHTRGYEYSDYRYVMRVVPEDCEEINETWISDQDRFSYCGLDHQDRIGKPLIKQHGEWQEVDWSIALNFAADHLSGITQQAGADKIGGLMSPSATVEEGYLLQKLLRTLGSHNIDHRLQQFDFADDAGAAAPTLGISIEALQHRDHILLIGSNLHQEQPVAGIRMRKAVLAGGHVAVINPADFAFRFPLTNQLINDDIIDELAGVAKALGIEADCLTPVTVSGQQQQLVHQLQQLGDKRSIILGALALNHPHAHIIKALAKAIAEKAGASFGYFTPGANSTGAWLAQCIPGDQGFNTIEMLNSDLHAYLLLGVEPEIDCAHSKKALTAMKNAFVMALTPFLNDTMRDYADVVLPIAPFAENEGAFVNIEGRLQLFSPATVPWQAARPAWKIVRVLGNLLKLEGFDYTNVEQIRAEYQQQATVPDVNTAMALPKQLPSDNVAKLTYWPLYCGDMLVRRSEPLQKMVKVETQLQINEGLAGWLTARQDSE